MERVLVVLISKRKSLERRTVVLAKNLRKESDTVCTFLFNTLGKNQACTHIDSHPIKQLRKGTTVVGI